MIYYFEMNIFAIIVSILMMMQGKQATSKRATSRLIFDVMLATLILFCASDMSAIYFEGKNHILVEASNIIYFMALAAGTYEWFLYVFVKLGFTDDLRKTIKYSIGPIALLGLTILVNHWTQFVFSIDANNMYHRESGVFFTWVVEWGYLIAALFINIKGIREEKREYKKVEYKGYLVFVIPMAVAALCQMYVLGSNPMQIGFAVAMLMVYMNNQKYQIQRDELTSLNNKNAFISFQDYLFSKGKEVNLTIFVVDADYFKQINDMYGHLSGDNALRNVADVLKASVSSIKETRLLLYRYGGDEFVVAGTDLNEEVIEKFYTSVNQKLEAINEKNHSKNIKYTISLSIGHASRICVNMKDFNLLMNEADHAMYTNKYEKRRK